MAVLSTTDNCALTYETTAVNSAFTFVFIHLKLDLHFKKF